MNRSQSWRKIPSEEGEGMSEDQRATSQPNLNSTLPTQRSSKVSHDELRRKIVRLNKELDEERLYIKQLKREKSVDLRHARDEEQRRAASQQTELKTKLFKEKANELAALKETMLKEKEKEILHITKQKDDAFKSAQIAWQKEKDELRTKIRAELWSDAREESKKEFDRERTKLEQDILDLQMQKKEIEEALQIVQESDKRKADEIRRILHEHDVNLEKFKRSSWQESRRQMSEIRQLLNIIEQLERKLGLDSGYINKLRMEKESLYDELRRKTNSFDAWDNAMKADIDSGMDPKQGSPSHELRTLQRKNVELSSLVKKLDEKNQQLATRNTELLSELEQCEKEAKDKNRKLEKKNSELTQTIKKTEAKNKLLQDELNSLKRKAGSSVPGSKDSKKSVRPRGQATDSAEVATLKEQIKDHAKTIEELKQNLMEKERRIDLLKERKRTGKKPKTGRSTVDSGLQPDQDDVSSVISDISDLSEMSSDSNSDANKLKKLTKELLALERAYAILQAQVGSTVDVERDELERQQLQSDLIESQARIHELERMMDSNLQGNAEELQELQQDNQVLYQKLVTAEKERDDALKELSQNTEHLKDLQDKKDLLEFELEEMSQLSFAGSEDEFTPRKLKDKDVKLPLSLEDVKAKLEEVENEKSNTLSDIQLEALRQARTSLTSMPQKISHLEATEAILRTKVKDLEERRDTISRPNLLDMQPSEMENLDMTSEQPYKTNLNIKEPALVDFDDITTVKSFEHKEIITELTSDELHDIEQAFETLRDGHIHGHSSIKSFENKETLTELTSVELCNMTQSFEKLLSDSCNRFCDQSTNTDNATLNMIDCEVMTDFVWNDIVEIEETYKEFLENMSSLEGLSLAKPTAKKTDRETATDFSYLDIIKLEAMGRQLEELHEAALKTCDRYYDQGCNTDIVEKHEIECNTDYVERCDVDSVTDLTMEEIDETGTVLAVSIQKIQDLENELRENIVMANKWEEDNKVYKESIDHLNELLAEEREMRKTLQATNKDHEVIYQGLVDRLAVEFQGTMARMMVEKAIGNALTTLANETIDKAHQYNVQEIDNLKKEIQQQEKTVKLLREENKQELDRLTAIIQEQEQTLERLHEDTVQLQEDNMQEVNNLNEVIQEQEHILEQLQKDNTKDINRLNTVIQEQGQTLEQLHEDNSYEVNRLTGVIQEQEQIIQQLQEELVDTRRADDMKTLTDLTEKEHELADLHERLTETEMEKNKLLEQIENFRKEIDVLEELLHKEKELREEDKNLLEKEMMKCQDLQQECSREISELRDTYEERLSEYEIINNLLLEQKNQAEKKIMHLNDLQHQLVSEKNELKKVHEEHLEKYKQLQEQCIYSGRKLNESHKKIEDFEELFLQQCQEIMARELASKAITGALVQVVNARVMELEQHITSSPEQDLREHRTSCEKDLERFEKLHQENLAQELVTKAIINALVIVVNSRMMELKQQVASEQELRECYEDMIEKYEQLHQESLNEKDNMKHERTAQRLITNVVADAVAVVANEKITDLQKQVQKQQHRGGEVQEIHDKLKELNQEKAVHNLVMKAVMNALCQVANETICHAHLVNQETPTIQGSDSTVDKVDTEVITELTHEGIDHLEDSYQKETDLEHCNATVMTDMSWSDVVDVEEKYQEFRENIQEIQDKLAKVDVDKNDVEVMTDCTWDLMNEQEHFYQQEIEDLQQQLSVENHRLKDEKATAEKYAKLLQEQEILYQQQLEDLQNQLIIENQKTRDERMRAQEYQSIVQEYMSKEVKDQSIITDMVLVQDQLDRTIREIVQGSVEQAIFEVANEAICNVQQQLSNKETKDEETCTELTGEYIVKLDRSFHSNDEALALLRLAVNGKNKELDDLKHEMVALKHDKEDLDGLLLQMNNFRGERLALQQEKNGLNDLCMVLTQQNQMNQEQISDLQEQLVEEHNRRLASEDRNQTLKRDLLEQMLPTIAQEFVDKVITSAIATEHKNTLQEHLITQEVQASLEEKLARYEEVYAQLIMRFTEEQQQNIAMNVSMETISSALVHVANDTIHDLLNRLLIEQEANKDSIPKLRDTVTGEAEVMTDLSWEDIDDMINSSQNLMKLTAANVVEQCTTEIMTDMSLADILEMEEKFMWIEMQEVEEKYNEQPSNSLPFSSTQPFETDRCDADVMTDLSLTDILEMEEKFLLIEMQYVGEKCHETPLDSLPFSSIQSSETDRCDADTMTDISWVDLSDVEEKFYWISMQDLDENLEDHLESKQPLSQHLSAPNHCNTEVMTDMSWADVVDVEEKYQEFRENIQEIQDKLAKVDVDKNDVEVMTDCTWDHMNEQEHFYQQEIEDLQQQLSKENHRLKDEKANVEQEQLYQQQIADLQQQLYTVNQNTNDEKNKALEFEMLLQEKEQQFGDLQQQLCIMNQVMDEKDKAQELLQEQEQQVVDLQLRLSVESQRAQDEKTKAEEYQLTLEQYMSRERQDECCMTDVVLVQDPLDKTVMDVVQQSQLEAIVELADEVTIKPLKTDQVVMTEFSWKEIEYLEKTYREWVEELRLMKKDLELKETQKKDQMCMTDLSSCQDANVMTDLDMEKMASFEVKCKTVSLDNEAMTDLKWDDITYLETTYMEKLEELRAIAINMEDNEHKETNDEESMTDLCWTEVVSLETSYKQELEKITALEESFHNKDMMDEETMTTLHWDEMESQLDNYRDQIESLKEMLEDEKAQRSIEQVKATEAGNVERSCMDELGWAFNMDEIEDDVEVDDDILVNRFQETKMETGSMTDVSWEDIVVKKALMDKCCSTDVTLQWSNHVSFTVTENSLEKESTTDLSLTDLSNMEDIYWQEIQRMEELSKNQQSVVDEESIARPEVQRLVELSEGQPRLVDKDSMTDIEMWTYKELGEKEHELVDSFCVTDQVLIDNMRVNTECMTELSMYDIDQIYDQVHITTDERKLKSNKPTDVLTDKFEPKDQHDDDGFGIEDSLEDSRTKSYTNRDQDTSTEITLDDMSYFEDLEVKHHELLMSTKQGNVLPLDKNGKPLRIDQQTETTITLDDICYYEDRLEELEKQHENISNLTDDLLESSAYNDNIDASSITEQEEPGQSNCPLVDQATETDLTDNDLDDFENLIHELKLENADYRNQLAEKELKNLEDKEIETELTLEDIDMYENELYKNEFGEKESKELEDKEIETELTLEDIDMFENSELSWLDYQTQSEQEIESMNIKYDELNKRKNSLESRFNELQQIHQQCAGRQTNCTEQGVDTELTLEQLSHFEEMVSAHQRCGKKTRGTNIGVATDLTLAEIHYLEEIDTVHTEYCVNTMDNDNSSRTDSSMKESKAVGTELTASVLEYLEEVASTHEEIVREYEAFRHSVDKQKDDADTMTEMTGEHLDYLDEMALKSEELENMLIDVTEEAKVKQYEYENKKKVFTKALMTELSSSDISSLENELSSLRQQQRDSRKSVKLSRSGYECLLDIDNSKKRHDIALMTEMTIDELKSLENSDNIYMNLKEEGLLSRLEDLKKPVSSHSMMTDLQGTNIDDLKKIEKLFNENKRCKDTMKTKQTETDMTRVDLTGIENIANKNTLDEAITVETSEAVFGSCPREKRGRTGRYGDRGRIGSDGNYGNKGVEVGVQCEIKDLMSLVQEQRHKDGNPDSQWYVSALKIKRDNKEGFDPVEVVLRSGRNSSTPDVSSRDHGNKRNSFIDGKSNTTSASLDYGWQSTMSLDASGLERTPVKGTALGRWDSPQVPLAQDEVFDLSDIDSAASDESLVTPLRKESAVAKYDRYVMARKESELELVSNLRDVADQTDGSLTTPRSMSELLKENEQLKARILELEMIVSQKGDLSEDELELLKQKIRQLQAAEQQMKELHESNSALKDRINQLNDDNLESGASTSRTDRSEGRTRLMLVQDWGLDDTDLESLFSAREDAVSPAESLETSALRRLLDEYVKSDHGIQAGPGPGINQEIQTTGDLVKLIDLSYDGTIPEHIAKELEKLKAENKELYEELLQLRKLKLENSRASESGNVPRDPIEEPITLSRQTPTESQNDWMTVLGVTDGRQSSRPIPKQPVRDIDDVLDVPPRTSVKRPQYFTDAVDEPEIHTSRSSRDASADIDHGINSLADMGDARQRADTDDILDFEFDQGGPPDSAPPPVPSQPPPDNDPYGMNNSSNSVFDNSPPRDSKSLRAASRNKNQPGRPGIGEATIQPQVEMNVEGQPSFPGQTDIPAALRVSQTPVQSRPGTTRQPPPTLPKPKLVGPGGVRRSLSREPDDESSLGLTPRGYVRATASAINQGEIDALTEKINFLEKQVKNKEGVIRSMKTEATEIENKALVERKEREIKILEDDVAFLKQENQKKERELLAKIGEINRKNYEVDQWKAEATNAEKQRKRIETSYMNLQSHTRNLHGANTKLGDLQSKYNSLEKENSQLLDKVNKLEKTEREFKQLEYNIGVLQNHLRDMESVEKERDDLSNRLKVVENQRDDLLKKGRMVESERNDFLRNNKIMEMQRDELEQRYAIAHEELMKLKATAGDLEQSIKEAENTSLDAKHECNYLQTQYKKLESDKIELEKQLVAVTRERNGLESRLADLEDRNRESLKLEDGFHTLRLKVAELTRQRDEFETQIPTLKAKIALLKKACKEKDEYIDKLNDEIRELRHSIATSTLDDLSKIKYSARKPKESKSPSTKTTPRKSSSFPKRCVALFDYNPQTASVSGQPDKELTLKEGDQLTLLSDMDIHGCYEAELNGLKGLVPGLYIEEIGESTSAHNEHVTRQRTPVTNGHVETTPRSTASDLDVQKQCFVALHDYKPYQMCTSGRPETELPFKKGDIMTVYGDIDNNGYYHAEMEGQTGLVPSNFVEEVSSSTYLQPLSSSSSTAPQQILSMFDNITGPSPQRPGSSFPLPTPPHSSPGRIPSHPPSVGIIPSSHVTAPPPGVVSPNHVIHSVPSTNGAMPMTVAMTTPRREQTIQPIFTPHMSPAEVQKLAAPIVLSRPRDMKQSPRQQAMTSKRSPSQPVTSPPRITSQNNSSQPVSKPKARQSKAIVSRSHPSSSRGAPSPPSNLHVIRPVNHDAILLGWTLPEMDEFGRSNGTVVKGYKIYENGDYKMDVRSQFMAKALVDDLDLRYPIQLSVRTIGEGDSLSNEASTTFTDTINSSRMSVSRAIEGTVGGVDQYRTFVALYDYDPLKSSPNSNPQYELQFNEGDILRVEDTSRKDGFYFGSLNGKKGLIPSNFIEEVAVAKTRGPSSPTRKRHDPSITNGTTPSPRHRKKMIALYDYSPNEQSPLKNTQSELSFKKGQSITVLGPMNKDGFYNAAIDGRQGLVPASFLENSLELSPANHRPPRSA